MKKKLFLRMFALCAALKHWIATSPSAVPVGTGSRAPRNDGDTPPYVIASEAWQSSASKHKHPRLAFSLIELLISLIIISVITASFAPIVTKKAKTGRIALTQNSKKNLTGDCPVHQNCVLCYENEKATSCLVCLTNCSSDEYSDKTNCNCVKCANKFNGCYNCNASRCTRCASGYGFKDNGCEYCGAGKASDGTHACIDCNDTRQYAKEGASYCSECPTGQKPNSNHSDCEAITCAEDEYLSANSCLKCSDAFSNCRKCNASACTECQSGYKFRDNACRAIKTPSNQSDCDKFGAVFIPNSVYNGVMSSTGVCMTKINAGDPNGPTTAYSNISTLVAANKNSSCANTSTPCCWSGALNTQTASTGDGGCTNSTSGGTVGSKYPKFTYPSCKRTVCNYAAAEYICAHYKTEKTVEGDWSLPSKSLVESMKTIVQSKEPCANPASMANSCYGPKFAAATAESYIQKYMGEKGLQLCDAQSGYGSFRCQIGVGRCYGSTLQNSAGKTNTCGPSAIWASGGYIASLQKGVLFVNNYSVYYGESTTDYTTGSANKGSALSVRCVLTTFVE